MTNLYGVSSGSPRVSAELLEPLLGLRFRRWTNDAPMKDWYVAEGQDSKERIVILRNQGPDGQLLEPRAEKYGLLLHIAATNREREVTMRLAKSTPFRFLDSSDKVARLVALTLPVPDA